jgi:hypothetical protein
VGDRGRLAVGSADVGLQAVAEAPVGVAVGAERGEDRRGRRPVQEDRQPVAVENTGVRVDEPLGGVDVDRHAREATRR